MTNTLPNLEQAEALRDEGRFDEALAACDALLAETPGDAAALDIKCTCFLHIGRIDEAEKAIRLAIRHLDGNPVLYTRLGRVLEEQHKNDDALRAYEQAVRFDGSYAPGFIGCGRIRMFHLYDEEGSISAFTAALDLDPTRPDAWFFRGLCYLGQHRVEEAQRDLDEALSLDPSLKERIDGAIAAYTKLAERPDA